MTNMKAAIIVELSDAPHAAFVFGGHHARTSFMNECLVLSMKVVRQGHWSCKLKPTYYIVKVPSMGMCFLRNI